MDFIYVVKCLRELFFLVDTILSGPINGKRKFWGAVGEVSNR